MKRNRLSSRVTSYKVVLFSNDAFPGSCPGDSVVLSCEDSLYFSSISSLIRYYVSKAPYLTIKFVHLYLFEHGDLLSSGVYYPSGKRKW